MSNIGIAQILGASGAVYLHWNGSPESVHAFVDHLRDTRRMHDPGYATARLAQIVGEFFGGSLSVGITAAVDPEDHPLALSGHGLYLFSPRGEIVARWRCALGQDRPLVYQLEPEHVADEYRMATRSPKYHGVREYLARVDSALEALRNAEKERAPC